MIMGTKAQLLVISTHDHEGMADLGAGGRLAWPAD
jgi:hypothetical protein